MLAKICLVSLLFSAAVAEAGTARYGDYPRVTGPKREGYSSGSCLGMAGGYGGYYYNPRALARARECLRRYSGR